MAIKITFPGGMKVDAEINGFMVHTDQRVSDGGEGTAPAPFELFLASIGACAGAYVNGFCSSRGLSTTGIEIEQKIIYDPVRHKIGKIALEVNVPPDFPEKYYPALVRSVEMCAVKKAIQDPPEFDVLVQVAELVK